MAELCPVPSAPRACPGFVADAVNDARMTAALQLELHARDASGAAWERACELLTAIADELGVPESSARFRSRVEERAAIDDVYRAVSAARGRARDATVDALRSTLHEVERARRDRL